MGISDRLFLMGMQLRLRTAVGQVLNRPTYVVEIDNFADISGLPDTLAQRRHWSEADRMVREQEPRIEMQFPVAEDNRETGATVSGNAHQQRQLVEDKLVVRIRVLMSTERDAIRGAQVLVDSLSSGTLLLLLRSKELAREVSFLEPPRAYGRIGVAPFVTNVLYECPQEGTGDLTMDDSGSNIGFQHWALVGWACLSLGLSVAAVFLCVHANSERISHRQVDDCGGISCHLSCSRSIIAAHHNVLIPARIPTRLPNCARIWQSKGSTGSKMTCILP